MIKRLTFLAIVAMSLLTPAIAGAKCSTTTTTVRPAVTTTTQAPAVTTTSTTQAPTTTTAVPAVTTTTVSSTAPTTAAPDVSATGQELPRTGAGHTVLLIAWATLLIVLGYGLLLCRKAFATK